MGALNIKDAKVAAKARRLAKLRGKSITAAVSDALDDSLRAASERKAAESVALEREVDAIVTRFAAGLKRGSRSPQHVIDDLYDEHGAPR